MTTYTVHNQWGCSSAPWHDGGLFNIGNRANQRPVGLHVMSGDGGRTLVGTIQYQGENPIGLRCVMLSTNCYHAEHQWGGSNAPWRPAGLFMLGAHEAQQAVAFNLASHDNGLTLTGTMTYAGDGPIGVHAEISCGTAFDASNQWGGGHAPWHHGGQWVIGGRADQAVEDLSVTSPDHGKSLLGTMIYAGEAPIAFRAVRTMANTYSVLNQWGGSNAPWHDGGTWILGGRGTQGILHIDMSGDARGLQGTMTYVGEEEIGLSLIPTISQPIMTMVAR